VKAPRLKLFLFLAPILAIWTAVCWLVAQKWPEVGVNLLADAISLWFVVFVLDWALQFMDEVRRAPATIAAWQRLHRLHGLTTGFINAGVARTFTLEDLPALRSAVDAGDTMALAPILARLVMHRYGNDETEGRRLFESLVLKGASQGEQFLTFYGASAEADLVRLVDDYVASTLVWHGRFHPQHHPEIPVHEYEQLIRFEMGLRKAITEAKTDGLLHKDAYIERVLPDLETWEATGLPEWRPFLDRREGYP
jgi:hypothetical protein